MAEEPHPGVASQRGYHHGDLRAALLAAAGDALRQHGPDGLSLRELARRCGVSRTAPYRHFASKDALLAALATAAFRDFADHLRAAAAAEADPVARLRALGLAYVSFATRHPERLRLMFGREAVAKAAAPELAAAAEAAYAILAEAVAATAGAAAGRGDGQPDLLEQMSATVGAWALVHGLALLRLELPPGVLGGDERSFLDLASDALGIYARGLGQG